MVEANDAKGKTKMVGSSAFFNCPSKASTPESSLSSPPATAQDESSRVPVVLPLKKRSVPINVVHENQNNAFPFKKRKFHYRDDEGEAQVEQNATHNANQAMEDNTEDKVGEKIINEMKVDASEAKEEEVKKDTSGQVSNPISLIAIAASWLTDAEAVAEPVLENKPTLPQAYTLVDESDQSEISEDFDIYGDDNNDDEANHNEQRELIIEAELNEIVTEKTEKKQFKKPRSSIPRRPKTSSTLQFNNVIMFVVAASAGDKNTEKSNEQIEEVEEEVDINNDDLYSKVKKRHQMGKMIEAAESRCTRVNGKGWRCSNHTSSGFALCEHHLGRQEMLRRVGGMGAAPGRQKRKPKYGSLKAILDRTPVIAKW